MQRNRQAKPITECGADVGRRRLLKQVGAAMVAAAFRPWPAFSAGQSPDGAEKISPVMIRLSTYMSEARTRALPEEVVEKAEASHPRYVRRHGLRLRPCLPVAPPFSSRASYGGEKIATVVACESSLCGPIEAALANGMLAHSDETDDSHAPSHVASGLRRGARRAGGGRAVRHRRRPRFLRAVALGYDIGPRVSMTLGGQNFRTETHREHPQHRRRLRRRRGRWLRGQSERPADALAARLCRAAILRHRRVATRYRDHIEKAFVFGGMPARNGVTRRAAGSIRLVPASSDIFSGADNFLLASLAQSRSRRTDRQTRRALRSDAHQHQEVDRRIAHSGARSMRSKPCARSTALRGRSGARR